MIPSYERLVTLLAGPLATGIGLAATALVHQNISHSAALLVATFVISGGTTYAAHHKWLSNLPAWWNAQALAGNLATTTPPTSGQVPPPPKAG